MAIAFLNAGTKATGSGTAITPGAPATPSSGDIWLCAIHSSSASRVISMDAAWTQIVQSSSTTGTFALFWFRYAGSTPTMVVSRSGSGTNGFVAGVAAFSGCVATGSPVDVQSSASTGTDGSMELANLAQPSVDGCMLICADGASDDNNRTTLPTSFAACFEPGAANTYDSTTGAPDTSIAIHYMLQATKAAVSGLVDTMAASDPWVSILLALKPVATGAAYSITGSVTATGSVAGAMAFAIHPEIAGDVTGAGSAAASMAFAIHPQIGGDVTGAGSVAAAMVFSEAGAEIVGDVTGTGSAAANMAYSIHPSIVGAVTGAGGVNGDMAYSIHPELVGAVTATAAVLGEMIFTIHEQLAGAVTGTGSVAGGMVYSAAGGDDGNARRMRLGRARTVVYLRR